MKKYHYITPIIILVLLISLIIEALSGASKSVSAQTPAEKLRFYDAQSKKWYKTKIDSDIEKHDYDWSYLVNNKKSIQYNDANYTIRKGIDVSYYNGKINWKKVKKAGIKFAIIRLGYRGYGTGSLNLDKQFRRNLKQARKVGLDVGVYFFSQAVNEKEAREEAQFVIKALKGKKLDLPVVYDPERILHDNARTDNVSGKQFTKNTLAFCKRIEQAGYDAMIYSNMYWEAFLLDLKKLADYPVWYADYKKKPQTPYQFYFWQYSSSGRVDGVKGRVDLNVEFVRKE